MLIWFHILLSVVAQYSLPLIALPNNLYAIELAVGSPPQKIILMIDTGSSLTWISQSSLSASDTLRLSQQIQTVTYADTSMITGVVGSDIVCLTENIQFRSEFVVATFLNYRVPFDGILGLSNNNTNIFYQATNLKLIETAAFTVSVSRMQLHYSISIDPQTLVVRSESDSWSFRANGIQIESNLFSADSFLIDSGCQIVILKPKLFSAIVSNCWYHSIGYVCSSLAKLPDAILSMYPLQYCQFDASNANYRLRIIKGTKNILGIPLFKAYNITFDKYNNNVGFQGSFQKLQAIEQSFYLFITVMTSTYLIVCIALLRVLLSIPNDQIHM